MTSAPPSGAEGPGSTGRVAQLTVLLFEQATSSAHESLVSSCQKLNKLFGVPHMVPAIQELRGPRSLTTTCPKTKGTGAGSSDLCRAAGQPQALRRSERGHAYADLFSGCGYALDTQSPCIVYKVQ